MYSIYGLVDPRTGQLRYIGQTKRTVAKRLVDHLFSSKNKSNHKECWIAGIVSGGLVPEVFVVELAETKELADEYEIHHIAQFRSIGCDLVNLTAGGPGLRSPSAETKRRISASRKGTWTGDKNPNYRRYYSAEERKRMSIRNSALMTPSRRQAIAASVAATMTPEHRKRLADANLKKVCSRGHSLEDPTNLFIYRTTGKRQCRQCRVINAQKYCAQQKLSRPPPQPRPPMTAEHKAKLAAARKGKPISAEQRAKQSAALKGRRLGPRSAETKAKLSAATKALMTPERRAAISAALKGRKPPPRSPEHCANISASKLAASKRKKDNE